MEPFTTLVLLVSMAAVGFAVKRWLGGRLSPLKDHSKKLDQVQPDGVNIVAPKPVHERRLKLALPDLSSIQIRSPVGPMKSSIRSALKELRSRQMVQTLCSKFESRLKVPGEDEQSIAKKPLLETPQILQSAVTRRREVTAAPLPQAVLVSGLTTENAVTTAARSNNLNKFLRSYASNLDMAISAERSVIMIAESDDSSGAEDEIVLTLPTPIVETAAQAAVANSNPGMKLELNLQTLQLESEYSNQCDSSPTADDESDVAVLVEGTDCEQLVDDDHEEGNNHPRINIKGFTSSKYTTDKQAGPETMTRDQDSKSEASAPASKLNLARFHQQVPANDRRLHALKL
ncbi:hypothetical protein BBO99_00005702 [Phytophthora kernoviae]|uniref:Uncharacterized protein n=1 Tax=Phytophthora kernoviae TaxID=325452 RepID=A0A3R7KIM9_9STRA|nr:hypothetical protein JM16_005450 [Phytophthora kernoviae]RLN10558.1 hypothetical protein BBI17_005734 [Phytophthora kernoviae]RLN78798.1 hypothetical protein BBO99_00005702 [Phytophthora kernoviae]